jgi:hypothetical protein
MKPTKSEILTFLFWANFAAFAMHVMDETMMAGGFVPFIQRHFWSGFAWGDFAVANAVWLILIAISNIVYDWLGNKYAFIAGIPLAFLWERCFNAFFHIGSTFYYNEYSPGLITGLLFFVILYLIARYGVLRGHLRWVTFLVSAIPALIFETLFVSSIWWAH